MGVDESNKPTVHKVWLKEFASEARKRCEFSSNEETAIQKLSSYDSVIASGISIAEAAPWYPKSYFKINDDLAGKWVTVYPDCYSCYQYTLDVVSKSGCSSGVYVEMSITNNGVAVDWTNDSLSALAVGQRGRMEFRFYPSGNVSGYSGSIAEANCY
jgi:hypothetical protein